jgi:serpin B
LALSLAACNQDADVAASNSAGGSSSSDDATGGTAAGGTAAGGTGGVTSSTSYVLVRSESAPIENPDISEVDYAAFISSANEFGLELMQEMVSTGDLSKTANGVFSPVSALMALAMTYGGAEGEAADAMKRVLHDERAAAQYHLAQNRLKRELRSFNYEGTDQNGDAMRVVVEPANSFWADRTQSLKAPFLDLLSEQYDGGIYQVDFRNASEAARLAINDWVMDKTHDKIQELLQESDVTSRTEFVLVNALYLFANWETLFAKTVTADASFATLSGGTVTASMMHQTKALNYKDLGDAQLVELPYVNGDLHLTLVLPDAGQFEAVRQTVSSDWLTTATEQVVSTKVALGMPKFTVKTDQMKLTPALENLGLLPGLQFTGISDTPVSISRVLQKAYIGTNESGTEAAAATAVVFENAAPGEGVQLTLDRPFLYFIQAENGLVLFAGQVTDPTATN